MSTKKNCLFSGLMFLTIIYGCLPYYYAPNTPNVPMFRQKGEAKIEIASGIGMLTSGAEFKGAYAAGNHFGLMFNTFFNNSDGAIVNSLNISNNNAGGNLFEAGLGYFSVSGNERFVFEVYGGAGGGKVKNWYDDFQTVNGTSGTCTINYSRYFVQPSFGYVYGNFETVISLRLAGLSFNNIGTEGGVTRDLDELRNNSSLILFEPAATIRYGWKPVKLQLQLIGSGDFNHFPLEKEFRYLSMGVLFTIPPQK